jgi:peptidoglycan/xylan/chitin deacetylase (PgdA/CDA1 family)
MIRNLLKAGTARVLTETRMDRVLGSLTGTGRLPLILGYHHVVEDYSESVRTSMPSLLISQRMLERHLDWVGQRYQFVSLDDLGKRLESGEPTTRPLAAVTFDDGYSDFYHHAVPLLRRKGIPATVFVVTDFVGTSEPQVQDVLYLLLMRRAARDNPPPLNVRGLPGIKDMTPYRMLRIFIEALSIRGLKEIVRQLQAEDPIDKRELESIRSLSWEELQRVRREGFVIGSHTKSHIVIPNEILPCIEKELSESRYELESKLGTPIRHFAYPSGLFNATSVKAVATAGYRFGYTGCTHRSRAYPLLTVPRTVLWENSSLDSRKAFSGSVLSCQVHRAFDLVSGCRQRHDSIN